MAGLGDIFSKGSVAEQFLLWGVVQQLVEPIMAPALQEIANQIWPIDPNVPLPANTVAELWARYLITEDQAKSEAERTGISFDRLTQLRDQALHYPDLGSVMELFRRGRIAGPPTGDGSPSLYDALLDQGIRPEWVGLVAELALIRPDGPQVLNAYLQGQITEEVARDLWAKAGMDPAYFTMMFDAEGTAPTPDMLATMANRGIIPWDGEGPASVAYHQGFLEGPWRNKWETPMRGLAQYLIPARSVVAMVRAGAMTDQHALASLRKEGLSAEDAASFLAEAHHSRTTADKELAKSEVIALYKDHKITKAEAEQHLLALKYSQANADLILSLADVAKTNTHLTAAVNRVHANYTARKLNRVAAVSALDVLGITGESQTQLLALWDLEIGANVKQLTAAQITAAYKYGIMTQPEADTELQHIGYSAFDSWVLLSIADKGALPGKPVQAATRGVNP